MHHQYNYKTSAYFNILIISLRVILQAKNVCIQDSIINEWGY